MKKRVFILVLFFLSMISLNLISSEIILYNDYNSGETIQGEILSLKSLDYSKDVFLYKKGIPRSISRLGDLIKHKDRYYLYMLLEENDTGEYTLVVDNENITFNVGYNPSILSINPGFIFTEKDSSIKIKSPYKSQEVNIQSNENFNFLLIKGLEEEIDLSVENITLVKINNYEIPVFLINQEKENQEENTDNNTGENTDNNIDNNETEDDYNPNNEDDINKGVHLSFYLPNSPLNSLRARILPNKDYLFEIILKNTGEDLDDILISSDFDSELNPKKLDLDYNEEETIQLIVNFKQSDFEDNRFSGKLIAEADDEEFYFPIYLELTNNKSEVVISGTNSKSFLHCSEFGEICIGDEECDGNEEASLEGPCCVGKCSVKKTYSKWLIAFFIFLIILVLIGIVYLKIKNQKSKSNIDKKIKNFQSRFYGKETHGNLDKV